MQVTKVSVDALTGVLADFVNHLKKNVEAQSIQLAASLDMSFSQVCSLFIMDASDHELALHELAERIGLSLAATGRAVDVLVREGLVTRHEDVHDRRVKRVSVTEAGRELLGKVTEVHTEGLRSFAELLTDAERQNLFNALAPILARPELQTHQVKEKG